MNSKHNLLMNNELFSTVELKLSELQNPSLNIKAWETNLIAYLENSDVNNKLISKIKRIAAQRLDLESKINKYSSTLNGLIKENKVSSDNPDFSSSILFLFCNPIETSTLRLDEEFREIQLGLDESSIKNNLSIRTEWALTTKRMHNLIIKHSPDIIHFSGHGSPEGLLIENELGSPFEVNNSSIANLFRLANKSLKCVVLNACYTESLASLILENVPYVIGSKNAILDKVAILFSIGFYTAIGEGKSIEYSYESGKSLVLLENFSEIDVPVLVTNKKNDQPL